MRAVRSIENDSQQAAVMQFIAEISRHSSENPHHPLSRILQERGYSTGSSSESDFFGSSGSFSGESSLATGVNARANFFNTREGRATLEPFVAKLAHRSAKVSEDGETSIVPWRGDGALLFIDLSGYSTISAKLIQSGGAHALSRAVNGYFESILNIVINQYYGDVVKFAGDAIVVVWAVPSLSLKDNALAATRCAIELQRRVGMYPVEGTDLAFRMHCGVTAGVMDSDVFLAKETRAMQRGFHFISGRPFEDVGAVVDSAGIGEVCVSQAVADLCGDALVTSGEDRPEGVRLVKDFDEDVNVVDAVIEASGSNRHDRSEWLERQLVPPRIAAKLRQGFKPSHMAEMRYLCVLFIHKAVAAVSPGDWFLEVQSILDAGRCPVVQIIDDDKGTHVVAAVNLFKSEADCASVGLRVARELELRKVGCSVGMACGEVYCGIVGCEDASRWDITGPACVRAARLMQLAVSRKMPSCIDETVYKSTSDVSQLVVRIPDVRLKGSALPVKVYGLANFVNNAPASIAAVLWTDIYGYGDELPRMKNVFAKAEPERHGHVVSGPVGSGKKTMILTALNGSRWTPLVHACAEGDRNLAIADTLGQWFSYHPDDAIATAARKVREAWAQRQQTATLDLALQLVERTIAAGLHTAFIVTYAQLMDNFSISLVREILRRRNAAAAEGDAPRGQFAVVLTLYRLHGQMSCEDLVTAIKRPLRDDDAVLIECYKCAYRTNVKHTAGILDSIAYWMCTERLAETFLRKSGGVPGLDADLLNYMKTKHVSKMERIAAGGPDAEAARAEPDLTVLTNIGVVDLGYEGRRAIRRLKWAEVSPQWMARFMELYDALPPKLQLILRAIAAVTHDCGCYRLAVYPVVHKLMPKATEDRVAADLQALLDIEVLKEDERNYLHFTTPAMLEVVQSLLTPDQDRVLKRLGAKAFTDGTIVTASCRYGDFYDNRYIAFLWRGAGDREKYHAHLRKAYEALGNWPSGDECAREHAEHALAEDIELFNDVKDVAATLGGMPKLGACSTNYDMKIENETTFGVEFSKNYMPSPALGGLAGEYQKAGYHICNFALALATARPGVEYLSEAAWKFLKVDIDAVMEAVERFEATVPEVNGDARTISGDEERKLLTYFTTKPATLAEVNEQAAKFVEFDRTVVQNRVRRIIAYVTPLNAVIRPAKKAQFKAALSSAYGRFLTETAGGTPVDEDPDALGLAFNQALMDLALANWRSPYMHLTLQMVRDMTLRLEVMPLIAVKAMCFSFLLMGTHISGEVVLHSDLR